MLVEQNRYQFMMRRSPFPRQDEAPQAPRTSIHLHYKINFLSTTATLSFVPHLYSTSSQDEADTGPAHAGHQNPAIQRPSRPQEWSVSSTASMPSTAPLLGPHGPLLTCVQLSRWLGRPGYVLTVFTSFTITSTTKCAPSI